MPDTPEIPDPAQGSTPGATPRAPTEKAPAFNADAAPAPRTEPSVADTARLLSKHFPALFGEGVIKPIKLRIQADIHHRTPGVFTKKALSFFLQRHTTRTAYLRALVAEGATRIDLDGQPAGDISAEHRDAAGVELERRRATFEAKKHAEREVSRDSRDDAQQLRQPQPPLVSQKSDVSQSTSAATGERADTRAARSVQFTPSDRPARSARPSRPGQAPERSRPPRPGKPQGAPRPDETRTDTRRRPQQPLPERNLGRAHEQGPATTPSLVLSPEQAAETESRRQRALLLRSFEQSPLSKANFGALKGLSEEALDAVLALARQERGSR